MNMAHPGNDRRSAASPALRRSCGQPQPFPALGAAPALPDTPYTAILPSLPVACEEFGAVDLFTRAAVFPWKKVVAGASQLVADTARGPVREPVSLT